MATFAPACHLRNVKAVYTCKHNATAKESDGNAIAADEVLGKLMENGTHTYATMQIEYSTRARDTRKEK